MTTDRPYKRAMSHVAAIAELRRHAGTQFDPELVESFCDLYSNEAPAPDPGRAGDVAASDAHAAPAITVPGAMSVRPARRRRRSDEVAGKSTPSGALEGGPGHARVADDGARRRARHRRESVGTRIIEAPVRNEHGTGGHVVARPSEPRPGRSETATR